MSKHEKNGDHRGHGCPYDPAEIRSQYERTASLALDRIKLPKPLYDEHLVLWNFQKDPDHFAETVSAWNSIADVFVRDILASNLPDEEKAKALFTTGFFYGRAFEEMNILHIAHSDPDELEIL